MPKSTLHLFVIVVVLVSGTAFGQPTDLAELLMNADEKQFAEIFVKFKEQGEQGLPILINEIERKLPVEANDDAKEKMAKRQANAAVALLKSGQSKKVWPLLKHGPDPTMRSYLIQRMAVGEVDPNVLLARLDEEQEISVRKALLLSLGEFRLHRISSAERRRQLPRLLRLYRDDPDSGIHGAAEWLLRKWWTSEELEKIDKGLATGKIEGQRQWYLNRQGQTMVVIRGPVEYWMGSVKKEVGRYDYKRHMVRVNRTFAIASKETTLAQYLRFHKDHRYVKEKAMTDDFPVGDVRLYEAAAYCNWLNEQEGIPKEQWCYEPNRNGKYGDGMKMVPNYLERTGYRLPTEPEWEYACRARAVTEFSFGDPTDLLERYARGGLEEFPKSAFPVGTLKPNDFGLFDMHGNHWEWCNDLSPEDDESEASQKDSLVLSHQVSRVLRGGSYMDDPLGVRSGRRGEFPPEGLLPTIGFRVARTVPLGPIVPERAEIDGTNQ